MRHDIKETKGRTGSNAKRFQDVFRFLGEFAAAAIVAIGLAIPVYELWRIGPHRYRACNACVENDARRIAATINDYYAIPENRNFPTLETLIEEYNLSLGCPGYRSHFFIILVFLRSIIGNSNVHMSRTFPFSPEISFLLPAITIFFR